jgi:hypothetical protein
MPLWFRAGSRDALGEAAVLSVKSSRSMFLVVTKFAAERRLAPSRFPLTPAAPI